jgi:hypothetical protein
LLLFDSSQRNRRFWSLSLQPFCSTPTTVLDTTELVCKLPRDESRHAPQR